MFRPGTEAEHVAGVIAERAWKGRGVHVYRWPCGTVAVVGVGCAGDIILQRKCLGYLFGTWARGASCIDVCEQLVWAGAQG
ncbi:MAG TPA: hypothetical protein VFH59_17370 [Frateuria sp.]|uniref:hypothetical protein n=1 Tax=Frateuria sp. TaxID=2211372 RepID=UPI002D7F47EE|nr:hypothetical protein [Frateuria sp.]HET6807209.1 hypothetical protein [Frateuria sp.]